MTPLALSWPTIRLLGDHLWQSTCFAAVTGLMVLAFRKNQARVRHGLWLAASMKFLAPFAGLAALGGRFGHRPRVAPSGVSILLDALGQPFSHAGGGVPTVSAAPWSRAAALLPTILCAIWLGGCMVMLLAWWIRWRRIAKIVRGSWLAECGPEVECLRRLEPIHHVSRPSTLVRSDVLLEPGVFGILEPVLVWPQSLSGRLSDGQIETILAHELAHVRCHDNLAAALHTLVEGVFWFHPLVWWLGARLMDERERACDEEVVRSGAEPRVYAESILKVCESSVRSPFVGMASVSGSSLTQRIERIMTNQSAQALATRKKILLAVAAVMAMVGPVVTGLVQGPRLRAQTPSLGRTDGTFTSVSITVNTSTDKRIVMLVSPDGHLRATNVPLRLLLRTAYQVQDSRIVGGPDWLDSTHFDIQAQAEGAAQPDQIALMLRGLLKQRFKLASHGESRDLPIFALVQTRTRAEGLRPSTTDCQTTLGGGPTPPPLPGATNAAMSSPRCGMQFRPGLMSGRGITTSTLSEIFSSWLGRLVVDRTAMQGTLDLDLEFPPEPIQHPSAQPETPVYDRPAPFIGPSFFAAVEEQLGLGLADQIAPVDLLVIDHVEKPAEQ